MGLQASIIDLRTALKPRTLVVGGNYAATRELFLRGISACFFMAFASFLLQVPGLYGQDGIIPVSNSGEFDKICLYGLLLSCLGMWGLGNVFAMYGMVSWYSFLVEAAPAPFYNYQWDLLIIEVGFVSAVLAPLIHSSLEPRPSSAALWMARFILFKLMFMSGVVKITSRDVSWTQLTAIWYHFATQCIPTPGAWFFHNLPLVLEQTFCAIMFMIEIPAACLILVPLREVQLIAALLQIALQLVIIFTGNYTFFNYLTIFLACTLLHQDMIPSFCRPINNSKMVVAFLRRVGARPSSASVTDEGGVAADGTTAVSADANTHRGGEEVVPLPQESDGSAPATAAGEPAHVFSNLLPVAGWICCGLCVIWTLYHSVMYGLNLGLTAQVTPRSLLHWTSAWAPRALIWMSIVIPVVTLLDICSVAVVDHAALSEQNAGEERQATLRAKVFSTMHMTSLLALVLLVVRGLVCFRMLSLMPKPLSTVAPSLRSPWTRTSLWEALPRSLNGNDQMPLGLSHYGPFGYGLFRVMTGIGDDGSVARPELVLEVRDAKGVWNELQFQYKPGDVNRRPPLIAPYQPRLDWEMSFQALDYNPKRWFISVLKKITKGSPAVLSLLDPSSLPDVAVDALRVRVYSYNFTTYGQSAWWRRTPAEYGAAVDRTFEMKAPLNLAQEYRKSPWDWRPIAVWGYVILVAAVYSIPRFANIDVKRILEIGSSPAEGKLD